MAGRAAVAAALATLLVTDLKKFMADNAGRLPPAAASHKTRHAEGRRSRRQSSAKNSAGRVWTPCARVLRELRARVFGVWLGEGRSRFAFASAIAHFKINLNGSLAAVGTTTKIAHCHRLLPRKL